MGWGFEIIHFHDFTASREQCGHVINKDTTTPKGPGRLPDRMVVHQLHATGSRQREKNCAEGVWLCAYWRNFNQIQRMFGGDVLQHIQQAEWTVRYRIPNV